MNLRRLPGGGLSLHYRHLSVISDLLQILLVALALAYAGLLALAFWVAPKLIFPFPGASYRDEPGTLKIAIGKGQSVTAVYLENSNAERLLLFHHGNAEDLGHLGERLEAYRQHGFAVLAYDYPGYGTSDGIPTAKSLVRAAEAVLAHAHGTLGWSHQAIISYGRSLGGGPALALAANHSLAGAVLEATFTSTYRVVTRWRLLPWDVFDNLAQIRRARCPVLIVHGNRDQTVPFAHGRQLRALAPVGSEVLWVEGANHVNVVEVAGEKYWSRLHAFAHRRNLAHSEES